MCIRDSRSINASWEAHRDFLRCLFELDPQAVVKTRMARYVGRDDFYSKFPRTAFLNEGSYMNPVTMPDLTI